MLEEEKAYCGKKLERLAMMPDTVVNVAMLKQVSVRLRAERPLLTERPVRTPEDAAKLVKDLIADFDREAVCIINLRNDLCPINFSICSIGTLTASMAEPREMIKAMCLSNATSFLMLHLCKA